MRCEEHGEFEGGVSGICSACWGEHLEFFWHRINAYVEECGGRPRVLDADATKPIDAAMHRLCELATFSHPVVRAALGDP